MKPCAYYNEFDPFAAQWLRNLIAAGHIAPGEVDERSITEVKADDLRGYTQCHFFAGIGGWSYALRLAGWPDDRPVWTGSCPCQPFSAAGKQRGSADERHLWPAFFDLIRECGPGSVFGEQVAGAAGYAWWDHVAADLEGKGYAAAAADLGAHSVGAPHIRQRLYWVAHADEGRSGRHAGAVPGAKARAERGVRGIADGAELGGAVGSLANSHAPGLGEQRQHRLREDDDAQPRLDVDGCSAAGLLGNAGNEGLQEQRRFPGVSCGAGTADARQAIERAEASTPWANVEWLQCSDGRARPTQPGVFPLVDGVRDGRVALGRATQQPLAAEQAAHRFNRAGALRGAGNAIVPQVAAAFVRAAA